MAKSKGTTTKKVARRRSADSPPPGTGGTQVEAEGTDWLALAQNDSVLKAVREHMAHLSTKATARSKITADVTSSRRSLEGRGLNLQAIRAFEAYDKLTAAKQAGFVQSLIIMLKAHGQPLQADLLAAIGGDEDAIDKIREAMTAPNGSGNGNGSEDNPDAGMEPEDSRIPPGEGGTTVGTGQGEEGVDARH